MNDYRCLVLDVDGVLTDGRLFVDGNGQSGRAFHVHDGFAIRWFQRLGGLVTIISGKTAEAVAARARELHIEHVIQGSEDKLADLRSLAERAGFSLAQAIVIGDDLPDLPMMRHCGYPIAVNNAVAAVRAAAKYVTRRCGGEAAVREAVEHVLRGSGAWAQVLKHYGVEAETRD